MTKTVFGIKSVGRPPINFADSVKGIARLENPYAVAIMDRGQAVAEDLISSIMAQGVMSYEGRDPRPALDANGDFQCTDMDMLSFLVPIAARGAVIEIPQYTNRRKVVRREGERKIGSSQFGPIIGLVSNKDVLSFSIKIFDHSIAVTDPETGEESMGAYRNYMIVDVDGHWYDGWDKIVWQPNAAENEFLNRKKLWTGNSVLFKHYVHPNRWQSVYGAPHILKKMLLARLDDEAGFYRAEVKRLQSAGINFQATGGSGYKPASSVVSEGETEAIKVQTIEMSLMLPEFSGSYAAVTDDLAGLEQAYERAKHLTYTVKPMVQFVARANEAAFMKYGITDGGVKIPAWMGGRTWSDWQQSKRHAVQQRMVLSNDMSLLFRLKEKTEHVSVA